MIFISDDHILNLSEKPVLYALFEVPLALTSSLGRNPSKFGKCSLSNFSFSLRINSSSHLLSSLILANSFYSLYFSKR